MDAKVIVYAIALLSLLGGVTGFYYTLDVDEAQKEFILTQQELGNITESIKGAQKLTDLRKEAAALITAAHIIEAENETIRKEAVKLSDARDNEARAFISAIEKVREATVGMVFPSIPLSNGTILKNGKIQSINENLTVIQHSEGVSKVPTETLSSEIQDRLRFGFIPGGAGSASNESTIEYNSSKKSSSSSHAPRSKEIRSEATDSLVRFGSNHLQNTPAKPAAPKSVSYNPEDVKINGDPTLWKGVERYSIGRAYVPGQGWLKVGSKGPIPGSGRK
jgi:hypothetical protein